MAEYKIKDLETLTGIKAHTIRIWEKRYGLISPERTETQIRTYDDSDLTMLLNIALLNKKGVKISKIASMSPGQISDKVGEVLENTSDDICSEKLILALIELDEHLFKSTLQEQIDHHGVEHTFVNVLVPFLDRIGVMWLVGTINPAQEHFISNLIRQKVISEIDKLTVPKRTKHAVMLFLPEHEWHEISLLFYQYVLRKNGIDTIYLGQSLPYDSLIQTIDKFKPSAVVTSWLTSVDPKFMQNYFKRLSKDTEGIKILGSGYQINSNYAELGLENYFSQFKDSVELLKHVS
ncbi:MAG: MerR family transcriptional regulator [Flavobacteriia bacterium]|jgi:DNA-binding transcriptional MerR regulator